jgi:hypothetical protein
MKPPVWIFLAFAHFPPLQAIPMPAREACTCQALSPLAHQFAGYDDAVASCNRIAKHIERWPWPLHTPKLADAFVNILNGSENDRKTHNGYEAESTKIQTSITHLKQVNRDLITQNNEGASTARATYIECQQRFRILCQRKPTTELFTLRPLHSLFAIFVGMALTWFFLFQIVLRTWFS